MMNSNSNTIKQILADRPFLALCAGIFAAALVLVLYIVLTIEPSSTQIHTRYSSVGTAHYYKTQWYYLYTFAAFVLVSVCINIAGMAKLYGNQRRDFSVGLGYVTLVVILITFFCVRNVLEDLATV